MTRTDSEDSYINNFADTARSLRGNSSHNDNNFSNTTKVAKALKSINNNSARTAKTHRGSNSNNFVKNASTRKGNNNYIDVLTNTRDNGITNLIPIDDTLDLVELQAMINIMNLEIIVEDRKYEQKRILVKP